MTPTTRMLIALPAAMIFAGLSCTSQAAEVAKSISFYKTKTCTGALNCILTMATTTGKQRLEITQVACRYALPISPDPEVVKPDTREILLDVKQGTVIRAEYPLQPFFAGLTPLNAPTLAYVNVNEQTFIPVDPARTVNITVALNAIGSVRFYGCTISGTLFTTQ